MRQLTVALLCLSLPVFAQVVVDVEDDEGVRTTTTVTVPGIQLNVNTRGTAPAPAPRAAPPPAARPPPPSNLGADTFAVDCGPMNGVKPSTIKVATPEGALGQVWTEDGSLAGQYSVPFNFDGRGGTYYRFILVGADGQPLLDRKLEAQQFIGCIVRLKSAAPAPAPVAAPAPAPTPAPAGMPDADFEALLEAVKAASFSAEKIGVITTAAKNFLFSVNQVGQLVDALTFSPDKIKAVELTRGRLVDPQNAFKLLGKFTFSADKEKVQKLLP